MNRATNTMNFINLRLTDLPTNKQIGVPPIASNKVEIQMAAVEAELVQITNDYIDNKCDDKGVPKQTNITKEVAEYVQGRNSCWRDG